MSVRTLCVVFLAIICGLTAAAGISQLRRNQAGPADVECVPVLVATGNITRGHTLSADDIRVWQCPKGNAPAGALGDPAEALGRAAASGLVKDEMLIETKLLAKDAGRGLASLIPSGMRAFTIQASRPASSVGGFLLPGNKVDVLLTVAGNPRDESGGGSTTTLLQSVEVLAVNQQLDAPADNRVNPKDMSSVTLLVTPRQAATLELGQNKGQLTLVLRNPDDVAQTAIDPATMAGLFPHAEPPPAEPKAVEPKAAEPPPAPVAAEPRKRPVEILVLRGSDRGAHVLPPEGQGSADE